MHKSIPPKTITLCGMFTAIVCIISAIPAGIDIWGVPATLQTFAIAFTGFTLRNPYGTYVCSLYLLLGFIGFPVFSRFTCGPAVLFGQNGGFLFGFLFLSFFSGLGIKISAKFKNRAFQAFVALILSFVGLFICHILGILQFSLICKLSFYKSFLLVSLPYLPKDILSLIAAFFCAKSIQRNHAFFVLFK